MDLILKQGGLVEELNVGNSSSYKGFGMCGVQGHERREKRNNKITAPRE